jgi:hypothetical protein
MVGVGPGREDIIWTGSETSAGTDEDATVTSDAITPAR